MVSSLVEIINNTYSLAGEQSIDGIIYDMIHDDELIDEVREALVGTPAYSAYNRIVNQLKQDM